MRWFKDGKRPAFAVVGGLLLLLSLAPAATAQKAAPKVPPPPPRAAQAPAPASNPRVIVVEPIRVFDPFFDYPYPYTYAPEYMAENFGYIKVDTKYKDASVYVDGGFADNVEKAKKFAVRPGTHTFELRDSDGRELFQEKVAVFPGKTTTLHVG